MLGFRYVAKSLLTALITCYYATLKELREISITVIGCLVLVFFIILIETTAIHNNFLKISNLTYLYLTRKKDREKVKY